MIRAQGIVHALEEGRGRILARLVPLVIALGTVALIYDFVIYRGLDDMPSMDNAQLARQIARGGGYTTAFIRPYALNQFGLHAMEMGAAPEIFPPGLYPPGRPRLLPDTYNAPGYPCLLAVWFKLLHPAMNEPVKSTAARHMYAGDRPIPWLNQIFLLLTAALVFVLGRRLFDARVAWLALLGFLVTDLVWQFSLTALPVSMAMFLVTAILWAAVEIFITGEHREEESHAPYGPAWLWFLALAPLLGLAGLTRMHLLVLLLPLGLFLLFAPRRSLFFLPLLGLVAAGMVAPWFWHFYKVSGSPFGSNGPLLHAGVDAFTGNQSFRSFQPAADPALFSDATGKESAGFLWHLTHAWELLGANPLVLLFAASLLHHFRRPRAQAFRWLLVGAAICLIASNSLAVPNPAALDAWNILVLLLPGLLVVGAAFFFILLDRLDLEAPILDTAAAVALIALAGLPLASTLLKGSSSPYHFPPYQPAYLRYFGQAIPPDQWITTDMPWATAWYSDRASLWLPDTVKDFEHIHDEICPSKAILLTQVTFDAPLSNLLTGEDKEWLVFTLGAKPPADFPLPLRFTVPNLNYVIWTQQQ